MNTGLPSTRAARPSTGRAEQLAKEVESKSNIRVFKRTCMVGAYNNNLITGFQVGTEADSFKERYIEIRANAVVVATGCIERPPDFRQQ